MYRPTVQIPVIAPWAHATPALLPQYAGMTMMSAATETAITAYTGTRWRFRRRKSVQPGIPLSRENAYQVREARVSPAAPQNSWPMTAIRRTALAAAEVRALLKIAIEVPPAVVTAFSSAAANRNARRPPQPANAR